MLLKISIFEIVVIWFEFVPKDLIKNGAPLVQIIAWLRAADKP